MNDKTYADIRQYRVQMQSEGKPAGDANLHWLTPHDKTLMRDLRYILRENQTEFWHRFGVGQSSGSRFERGMAVPLPVLLLIRLYFLRIVADQDLQKVHSPDYANGVHGFAAAPSSPA